MFLEPTISMRETYIKMYNVVIDLSLFKINLNY